MPDVARLLRRQLVLPALSWAAVPAVVWCGLDLAGRTPTGPLGAGAALIAMAGAALALRRGARTVTELWLSSEAHRAADTAAELAGREQAEEFWQRASMSLEQATGVLTSSYGSMAKAHHESLADGAAQYRDFRSLTTAWLDTYRRTVDEIVNAVQELLVQVKKGQVPSRPAFPALHDLPPGGFNDLGRDLALLGHTVLDAVVQAAAANTGTADAELAVFANLAMRLRSRADRVLVDLDGLEKSTEDPDALKPLLRMDHKVVQIRRDTEAVTVLAGGRLRQTGDPVPVPAILRQATAEIEEYGRVGIGDGAAVQVVAYARSALIHVLAALLENATRFSRDPVRISSSLESGALKITVEDRGLHMPAEDRRTLNALLTDADPALVRTRLEEGRIGLLVVAELARQYDMHVALHPGSPRGTRAVVLVPATLLIPAAADPVVVPRPPKRALAASRIPVAAAPGGAGEAGELASISSLPAAAASRGTHRRDATGDSTGAGATEHGAQQRPGLPRRHRTPAPTTSTDRSSPPVPEPSVATPGLAGDFLNGAQQAGEGTSTQDAAPSPHPAT